MAQICKKIRSLIRNFDLFSYSSFLRFKGDTQFKTATGGFFSILVLIIFAILFANLGVKMIRRQIINGSSFINHQTSPTPTKVNFEADHFMLAFNIDGIHLNHPTKRYFDITMAQKQVSAGFFEKASRQISLVPCSQSHFSINKEVMTSYQNMPTKDEWLCPQLHTSFQIYGKLTGQLMNYLSIQIKKCDPSLNSSRVCANQTQIAQIQQIGPFYVNIFLINPLINPKNDVYKTYYLDDRNYVCFNNKLGVLSDYYIQDYKIETDESILPFTQTSEESGVAITQKPSNTYFVPNIDLLAEIYFYKSSSSTLYSRSFYKVDQFFSYIGGLVGVIITGMFLLSSYNEYSFEGELASALYVSDNNSKDSNFIQFFKFGFYSLFKRCLDGTSSFSSTKKAYEIREQVSKELDLSHLLRRIYFLERAIQALFTDSSQNLLKLTSKLKSKQAKIMRQFLYSYDTEGKSQTNNCQTTNNKMEQSNEGNLSPPKVRKRHQQNIESELHQGRWRIKVSRKQTEQALNIRDNRVQILSSYTQHQNIFLGKNYDQQNIDSYKNYQGSSIKLNEKMNKGSNEATFQFIDL